MHLREPQLLAYHDQALSAAEEVQARDHLNQCLECQQRLEAVVQRRQQVYARLDILSPGPVEQPRAARAAYARFAGQKQTSKRQKEIIPTMAKRRTLVAALAILTVLVMVFTVPPVRAWGSSFLNMFRVQRVQVFTFNPDAITNARGQINENRAAIEQVFQEDLEIQERGPVVMVSSAEEAAQIAGFTPRLPAGIENAGLGVKPGMDAFFTINQPKHQALIDAAGVDIDIPAEIDGAVVTIKVSDAVIMLDGCDQDENELEPQLSCTNLVQMPSPVINAPDGLDMPRMGEAMFTFLGLPANEARQLSQRIDWTSTLVLPIPAADNIRYQDVQVDGVTGSLMEETNREHAMLVWVKDGILYGLSVPGSGENALAVANSLR